MLEGLPESLIEFVDFLQKEAGFSLDNKEKSKASGDIRLIFVCSQFSICIYSDHRVDWFIEISQENFPQEWYDTALIREVIAGKIDVDEMSLEEKVSFWSVNLPEVKRLFQNDATLLHSDLKRRKLARAQRMFPKLFQ